MVGMKTISETQTSIYITEATSASRAQRDAKGSGGWNPLAVGDSVLV
jgi:hypothetical protein